MTDRELAQALAASQIEARAAVRIGGAKSSYRRDSPREYAAVMAYLDGGPRPTVTTHMGKHLVLEEDVRLELIKRQTIGSGIYWGALVGGQFYVDHYGSPNNSDLPVSAAYNSGAAWDKFTATTVKKPTCIHHGIGSWNFTSSTFDTAGATRVRSHGGFSHYVWGASDATNLNNVRDNNATTIAGLKTRLFQPMKDLGYPILLRPMWEMNGGWFAWGNGGSAGLDATEYIAVWRNLWQAAADLWDGTHTGNISWFWCPNDILSGDPTNRFPGVGYVDWVGMDCYAGNATWQSPSTIFDDTLALVTGLAPGLPVCIGETGCRAPTGSPGKASWVTEFLTMWLPQNPIVKMFNWYNRVANFQGVFIEEGDALGEYDSFARDAFRDGIASSYFHADIVNSTSFPSGAKVPIP